jgi:hypothetical protein
MAVFYEQAEGDVCGLLYQHLAAGVLQAPPLCLWRQGWQFLRYQRYSQQER